MKMKERMEWLRKLEQLDVDAVGAYEAAIRGVKHPLVADKLRDFQQDHVRHIEALRALIDKWGGDPLEQDRPDMKGAVMKALTRFTGLLGTEAVLGAMIANEELTNAEYLHVTQLGWDGTAQEVLEKNFADERRHITWIKEAFKTRPWAHQVDQHA